MNINSAFPGTFVKAADLQGKHVRVTIDTVKLEEVGGEHKPVLYFVGKDRGLVLNKTNGSIIADMYGPETDDWHGKAITIYPARVEFQGKIVDAIRVKLETLSAAVAEPIRVIDPPPANSYAEAKAATPRGMPVNGAANGHARSIDDEIPF